MIFVTTKITKFKCITGLYLFDIVKCVRYYIILCILDKHSKYQFGDYLNKNFIIFLLDLKVKVITY